MRNRKKPLQQLLLAVLLFSGYILPASALVITHTDAYSQNLTAAGYINVNSPFTTLGNTVPFDPSLGTLEGVDLSFSGSTVFSVVTGASWYTDGYGAIIPMPYVITPTLTIDIAGINGYFSFGSPISLSTGIPATGFPGAFATEINYSFSFSYNNFLDTFLGPSDVNYTSSAGGYLIPPVTMGGHLNDFIDDASLLDMLALNYELGFVESARIPLSPTLVNASSLLNISTTYHYTPYQEVSVPEPDGILLFAIGLLLLMMWRYKDVIRN